MCALQRAGDLSSISVTRDDGKMLMEYLESMTRIYLPKKESNISGTKFYAPQCNLVS